MFDKKNHFVTKVQMVYQVENALQPFFCPYTKYDRLVAISLTNCDIFKLNYFKIGC